MSGNNLGWTSSAYFAPANELGGGMGARASTLKMDAAQLQAVTADIRNNVDVIDTEIKAHEEVVNRMAGNPYMRGSIESVNIVMEKCRDAHAKLKTEAEEIIKIMEEARTQGGETETQFTQRFQDIAGDDFAVSASLSELN